MDFLRRSLKSFSHGFSRIFTDFIGTRALRTLHVLTHYRIAHPPAAKRCKNLHRTSKFTVVPATIFCPAAGVCETMMLAGLGCGGGDGGSDDDWAVSAPAHVGGVGVPAVAPAEFSADAEEFPADVAAPFAGAGATLILPNLNPESCSARLAVPSGCPMKLGITYA
jgi:hypothetical protein